MRIRAKDSVSLIAFPEKSRIYFEQVFHLWPTEAKRIWGHFSPSSATTSSCYLSSVYCLHSSPYIQFLNKSHKNIFIYLLAGEIYSCPPLPPSSFNPVLILLIEFLSFLSLFPKVIDTKINRSLKLEPAIFSPSPL